MELNKTDLTKRCNCMYCDFYYRHFRLVKMLKLTLFDTLHDFIIWYSECVKWKNCFVYLDNNAEEGKKRKADFSPLRFRESCTIFGVKIIPCFKDNGTISDKVISFNALCFPLWCTDRDVWIASKRLRVFFVRARPARSTAAVKRSKDQR